jgi:hypothetical protein
MQIDRLTESISQMSDLVDRSIERKDAQIDRLIGLLEMSIQRAS